MYVNGSGRDYYEFFIQLNRCGTLGKNSHHDDARKNPTVGDDKFLSISSPIPLQSKSCYVYEFPYPLLLLLNFSSTMFQKNFMWNTITVQYNPLIEEEFDEHFKVTCEYGYDFWKTVTFPFLDVEVATGNL